MKESTTPDNSQFFDTFYQQINRAINDVCAGKIDPKQALAVNSLSNTMLKGAAIQIQAASHGTRLPALPDAPAPVGAPNPPEERNVTPSSRRPPRRMPGMTNEEWKAALERWDHEENQRAKERMQRAPSSAPF